VRGVPAASHEGRHLLVHAKVTRNRPLLVGYDGSPEAAHAIEAAAALLTPTDAVVLTVAPRLTPGESFVTVGSPVSGAAAFEGLNESDATRQADAGAHLARAAGFHASARVCVAAPRWEGIVDSAREIDAAVIVLGSKRRGDVSHDVANHAGRPLLVVRPRIGEGPILIAYDGSAHSRRAIEAAGALVCRREAVVLEAAPLRVSVGYSTMPSDAPWVDAADPTLAYADAQDGVDLARLLGFDARARTAAAPATWRAVRDVAEEIDASLIVVGSRGLTGAREVVEHSVSHDIAKHTDRPVLVVPPYSSR
jgi:nucleotide-binding universal stress UspA family protein